eukprot:SAG11_NODE_8717_length_984_cov_0.825989_1_plen_144_part_01
MDALDEGDAREICEEEGVEITADMTLVDLRRALRQYWVGSGPAASSTVSPLASTPEASQTGIESVISHQSELAEYFEMIDSLDDRADAQVRSAMDSFIAIDGRFLLCLWATLQRVGFRTYPSPAIELRLNANFTSGYLCRRGRS